MAEPLLKPGDVVRVPALGRFVASDRFIPDLTPGAPVRIAYLLGGFQRWMMPKVEGSVPAATLQWYELQRNGSDRSMISELGGAEKVETTLSTVFSLMEAQRAGTTGPLANNGFGNTFYVRDTNGELRAVNIHWCDDGWGVEAVQIVRIAEWPIRDRVFAPAP
jgi:hypothetical protein